MVIDANLLVVILTGDERRDRVVEQFVTWLDQRVELHAPVLAQYEVVNALTRLVATGTMKSETAEQACSDLLLLPIQYKSLRKAERMLEISLRLKRKTAYDAAYLALAEDLSTELRTLDGPLYRNASQLGFQVRLLV